MLELTNRTSDVARAWQAATTGISSLRIRKPDIIAINITDICKHILASSGLALQLLVHLLTGTIYLLDKQLSFLSEDIKVVYARLTYTTRRAGPYLSSLSIDLPSRRQANRAQSAGSFEHYASDYLAFDDSIEIARNETSEHQFFHGIAVQDTSLSLPADSMVPEAVSPSLPNNKELLLDISDSSYPADVVLLSPLLDVLDEIEMSSFDQWCANDDDLLDDQGLHSFDMDSANACNLQLGSVAEVDEEQMPSETTRFGSVSLPRSSRLRSKVKKHKGNTDDQKWHRYIAAQKSSNKPKRNKTTMSFYEYASLGLRAPFPVLYPSSSSASIVPSPEQVRAAEVGAQSSRISSMISSRRSSRASSRSSSVQPPSHRLALDLSELEDLSTDWEKLEDQPEQLFGDLLDDGRPDADGQARLNRLPAAGSSECSAPHDSEDIVRELSTCRQLQLSTLIEPPQEVRSRRSFIAKRFFAVLCLASHAKVKIQRAVSMSTPAPTSQILISLI